MARDKLQKPLTEAPPEPDSSSDQQPSGSSTEADDATTEDADEASSSSDEEEQNQTPSTPPPPSKKPTTVSTTIEKTTPQSSSSDEEDDDDNNNNSDSDDEPEPPVAKLKPTITTKPRSKPTVAALAAEKRPAENTQEKDSSKRARKEKPSAVGPGVGPAPNEEGSKKLFQRVFSEDDEIAMLKGLIEFRERKGGDPMKNDVEFYNFIKKLLHVDVNKVQIVDKVRRLKKKFNNAKKKNKKITNEHEKKMFELSKNIWEVKDDEEDDNGDEKVKNNDNVGLKSMSKGLTVKSSNVNNKVDNDNDGVVVLDKKSKKKEDEGGKGGVKKKVVEEDGDDEMDEDFKVGEDEAKEGMRVEALRRMGAKGRAEIREMWRKVENAQLEVDLMRNEARVEENKRVMEALGLVKR